MVSIYRGSVPDWGAKIRPASLPLPEPAERRLGLHHLNDFTAFIFAAVGASAVGADLLVAIGALGHLRHHKSIMGSAGGGTALRVAAFGIWHGYSYFLISLTKDFTKFELWRKSRR
jgi:hypothetical protein